MILKTCSMPLWLLAGLAERCRYSLPKLVELVNDIITDIEPESGQFFWEDPKYEKGWIACIRFSVDSGFIDQIDAPSATPRGPAGDIWAFFTRPLLREIRDLKLKRPVTKKVAAAALRQAKMRLQEKLLARAHAHRRAKISFVYFIATPAAIKIGCTDDAASRLRELQVANPDQLCLLGVQPGDRKTELQVHRRFRTARIRGEWFRRDPKLLKYIEERCNTTKTS